MTIPLIKLELSTMAALVNHVRPNLRATYVNSIGRVVQIRFFFDGEVVEFDHELMEVVITEIVGEFWQEDLEFDCQTVRLDYPEPFPEFGECVYLRYEVPVPEALA